MSMNSGCLLLSPATPLVEAYKQGVHSAYSVIIPVIKKSTLDPNVVNKYRPITISSVHTMAIESFIIPSAEISDNQFGFRESRGTAFA